MIQLRNEGKIQPPPTLDGPAQVVSAALQSWPNMISVTHWQLGNSTRVDGAEFHTPEGELGHIHVNGHIHLALTDTLRQALVSRKLAKQFRYLSSWVEMPVTSSADADHALWLFRLGYDNLRATPEPELLARIQARSLSPA